MNHSTCDLCGRWMAPGEGKPIRLCPMQFLTIEIKYDGGVLGPLHVCDRCVATFVAEWVAEIKYQSERDDDVIIFESGILKELIAETKDAQPVENWEQALNDL